jgi:hypothetical protein
MADESGEERLTIRSGYSGLRFLLVLLLILAAISALLHLEKLRRQKDIGRGKEKLAALVAARPVEQIMAQRARFYQVQYFLGYPRASSFAAADLSRRLCGVFGPGRIFGLQIDPGRRDLRFELSVAIGAEPGPRGAGKALETFAGLYAELGDFADLSDLSFTKKDPADGGRHVFTVSGQAELP